MEENIKITILTKATKFLNASTEFYFSYQSHDHLEMGLGLLCTSNWGISGFSN